MLSTSRPTTNVMHLPRFLLPIALLLLVLGVAPTQAQQVPGDNGLPPTNAKECRAKVKGVDAALKWEYNRWAKLSGKKLALRAAITAKIDKIAAKQVERQARMDEITGLLAADPPPSEDDAVTLQNE